MPMPTVRSSTLSAAFVAVLAAMAVTGCSTGASGPTTGTGGTPTTGTGGAGTGTGGAGVGTGGAGVGTGGAVTGTGGATTDGGSGGTAGGTDASLPTMGKCAGAGTRALASGKVDDFEADPILPGWSSFSEVMPAHDVFKITRQAGGAIGTGFAGHYMGTGAKTTAMGGFGAGTLFNIAIDKTNMVYCVDVRNFDGVTFWAKAATDGAKVIVNFIVPTTNPPPDGDCTTACFNHPQKIVSLTAAWVQYSVPFADAVGGANRVTGVVQQLGWLTPDANWDFWIDEIQFYKGTPPTTAVGGNSTN